MFIQSNHLFLTISRLVLDIFHQLLDWKFLVTVSASQDVCILKIGSSTFKHKFLSKFHRVGSLLLCVKCQCQQYDVSSDSPTSPCRPESSARDSCSLGSTQLPPRGRPALDFCCNGLPPLFTASQKLVKNLVSIFLWLLFIVTLKIKYFKSYRPAPGICLSLTTKGSVCLSVCPIIDHLRSFDNNK